MGPRNAADVLSTAVVKAGPNRSGGPDPAVRGARPADVLLAYLAAAPSAPPSGYVEFTDDDGLVTSAVAESGEA